jgi:hypothetical protein
MIFVSPKQAVERAVSNILPKSRCMEGEKQKIIAKTEKFQKQSGRRFPKIIHTERFAQRL